MEGLPVYFNHLKAPRNDFLDTYTPHEPAAFVQCRELADWFEKEAVLSAGSVNCRDISGVGWSCPTGEELSNYYAPTGGMSHCIDLVVKTAEIVTGLAQRHIQQDPESARQLMEVIGAALARGEADQQISSTDHGLER